MNVLDNSVSPHLLFLTGSGSDVVTSLDRWARTRSDRPVPAPTRITPGPEGAMAPAGASAGSPSIEEVISPWSKRIRDHLDRTQAVIDWVSSEQSTRPDTLVRYRR